MANQPTTKLGIAIKKARKTCEIVALELEVQTNTVHTWCSGVRAPNLQTSIRLAELLGITTIEEMKCLFNFEKQGN